MKIFFDHIELWLSGAALLIVVIVPSLIVPPDDDIWKATAITAISVGTLHGIIFWAVRRQRQRAEEMLRRSEERARQSQKMEAVGILAGGVAHDFNNLLLIITGHSDLLAQSLADDSMRDSAKEIGKAAERASSLTRRLLAFSRGQTLEPRVVELKSLVRGMKEMVRRLIRESIDLELVIDPRPGRVKADPGQIEQVIMNLVANAGDAMPGVGTLSMEVANVDFDDGDAVGVPAGSYVMLAVSDTGCGMDAETRSRIFDPFFTTKKQPQRTGLGLSTVYGIIKQSGGNITVDSDPGLGTTFKAFLPRVEETVDHAPRSSGAAIEGGTETVLLVEDESAVRALIRKVLSSKGYTVLEAGHPDEALRLGESHEGPIHLTLTDIVMPGMNGRELARRVMSSRQEMKVLYMSGYSPDSHHAMLEPDGVLLAKPFSPEALLRKVRDVLDLSPRE